MILTNADFSLSVNGFERLKLSLSEKMMESSDGVNELFFLNSMYVIFFLNYFTNVEYLVYFCVDYNN